MTPTSKSGAPKGQLEHAAWIAKRVLWMAVRMQQPQQDGKPWSLTYGGAVGPSELPARWLECSDGLWMVTTVLPSTAPAGRRLMMQLRVGTRTHPLSSEPIAQFERTPAELAAACRDELDRKTRDQLQTFLLQIPEAHDRELGPALAANLNEVRDQLRRSLPTTPLEPGPCSARLESVIRINEHSFWLSGLMHHASPREARLTAVSPEGARAELPPGAITYHDRPRYSISLRDDETVSTLGFHAFVSLEFQSRHPTGWLVEFRMPGGPTVEDVARKPVADNAELVQEQLREQLRTALSDDEVMEHQVLPALESLRDGPHDSWLEEVLSYGESSSAPEVSIVIAVRRLDWIEHQLAQFVRDPEIRAAEIIYVACDPPTDDDGVAGRIEELHDLYGIPLRLARVSGPTGRARALNLGATLARASMLVLMTSDLLPAEPGWLGHLSRAYAGSPTIGAVAPKLLREDDSIAQAGFEYVRRHATSPWRRRSPFAGLARTVPAANAARRVMAASEACLMLATEQFHQAGGFTELYLGDGEEEGSDLCLRLTKAGLETWYIPEAELYLLDRRDIPVNPSPVRDRFNQWLVERRCGPMLAEHAERDGGTDGARPASPRPGASLSLSGSGRAGSPIERLEVTAAELDENLLDASLKLPSLATERSLYESTYSFVLAGWALPREGGPLTIEVRGRGTPTRRLVAEQPSKQLAELHPDTPGADARGFQFVIGSLSLPAQFELEVEAITEDGACLPLGRVRGRRRVLRSSYRPVMQPLLITMLGRSGSNWLITLLSQHPAIVACMPFMYEPMLTSYWTAMLRTLAEPGSYMQALMPELYDEEWWTGSGRRSPLRLERPHPEMARWLGNENIEALAGFAQNRLDAFYSRLAQLEGERSGARYFVEKCVPGGVSRAIDELYPDGREIVLVRDFRDRVCSILDFNAQRGHQLWGRDRTNNDEEWFAYLRTEALDLLATWRERADRTHLVRYEDLIRDPEASLAGICDYLGIDAGARTISETIGRAKETMPRSQRDHQTAASIEESIGRWKRELTAEQQASAAAAFDDILAEFGYEPTDGAVSPPKRRRQAAKKS